MPCYHQMGDKSSNLLFEADLGAYAGAVLSPVNEDSASLAALMARMRSRRPDFEMVFDPQLYFPQSEQGQLRSWPHFPSDVDTADLGARAWWTSTNDQLAGVVNGLNPHAVCSPTVVPKAFRNDYYSLMVEVGEDLKAKVSGCSVLQSVIISLDDMTTAARAQEVASIISKSSLDRIFLVIVSDINPRRELSEVEGLKGVMRLIRLLEGGDQQVLVGFSSTDMALWKAAGATSCATGKHFNLRRFTRSRFDPPTGGSGQLPYACEESLLALLRASDVVRVQAAGAFSAATLANPYTAQILQSINDVHAWLGLGWRHYLWWFANFEARANRSSVMDALRHADRLWKDFDALPLLMEERNNDGAWVRQWLRALVEF